uniref:Uncharacterized protein n=1 Tax=Tanacetum cinerariifolium TaxID=118510 RepID=A0A699JJG8_TANCI|nr:hypothetical protein [Tanacetum cinerariifolium]
MLHKRNVDYAYLMWEDFVYQVEHKDHKKSNEMYYPRFTKVIIHHFMSKDLSIPRRNKFGALLPIELANEEIRNSNAYKEYYAVATGAAPPKPKASFWRTRSSFDASITPPTATSGPRLTTFQKGKQAAKASKAKNEGTGSIPGVPDVPTDESEEELSWNSTEDKGDDKGKDGDGDDDDNGDDGEERDGMESVFETISQMGAQTPTSVAPFLMSAPTITHSTIATITTISQAPTPPTIAPSTIIQDLPSFGSLFGFDNRLRTLEANFFEFMQTNQFTGAVSAIPGITSYAVAADLSEMDLKKILMEKIEGNKSIQRSDEQSNLYKALVEAYESDKIILDIYEETVTLKRRQDDNADEDEEPSAGPDRGFKRRKEGKEPESTSAPTETATRSAGRSTQGTKSRQASTSEPTFAEEPM